MELQRLGEGLYRVPVRVHPITGKYLTSTEQDGALAEHDDSQATLPHGGRVVDHGGLATRRCPEG